MDYYAAHRYRSKNPKLKQYHFHDQYEILLALGGGEEMFVADRSYPLRRGSLILLPPDVLHRSVAAERGYDRYVIRFSRKYAQSRSTEQTDLLRCFQTDRVCWQLTQRQTERLCALFEPCAQEQYGFGADLRRDVAFLNLLLEVNAITGAQEASPVESRAFQNSIAEILSYIPEHLTDDLRLEALAERAYLSKSHFCALFKESTGFSPGDFIVKTRVMRAQALLAEGRSVAETCAMCGFRNYTHFIRTFHRLSGVSPGQYKKQG